MLIKGIQFSGGWEYNIINLLVKTVQENEFITKHVPLQLEVITNPEEKEDVKEEIRMVKKELNKIK